MRRLHRYEMAATWLYHTEYGAQSLRAIDFWRRLSSYEKTAVRQMVADILEAQPDAEEIRTIGHYRKEVK